MIKKTGKITAAMAVILILIPSFAYARGNMYGELAGAFLVWLIIFFVVMLILREVVCWYWKINQQLVVLKEIRDALINNPHASNMLANKDRGNNPANGEELDLGSVQEKTPQEIYESGFCPECGTSRGGEGGRCAECQKDLFHYAQEAYKKK